MSFWLVAFITLLGSQRSLVLDQIAQHVIQEQSTKESTSFNVSKLLQDPLLAAAISETLRLKVDSLSVREVEENTTITINETPYVLAKGSMIFLTMSLVHKDPEIFDNPQEFQLERFLNMDSKVFTKKGVPVRNPLFPWGGGQFMVSCTKHS